MPVPNRLVEELVTGNCVLFLGAGISVGTREERAEGKGLLSGASLTQILAEKSGYCRSEECPYYWASEKGAQCGFAPKDSPSWPEQYCRASLLRVSQYLELHPEYDRAALVGILRDKIPDDAPTLRTHTALSQIALLGKMPFVITTNYDTLLEKALTTRVKCNVIVKDEDLSQYRDNETQIVKLHGTIGYGDSYVVTEADYLRVSQRLQLPQSLIGNTLRYLLSSHTILYIGYSLEDQDFRALYHDIVSTLGRHQKTAFAVQWKPTEGSRRFWEKLNVQIIDQDAARFLEELVGESAITLAQREGRQAIPALEQLLGEIDPIIGKNVASAMARIESEAIVPILCQFLRGPITGDEDNLSIRVSFVRDLEEIAPQRAMSILEQILYDNGINPYVRTTSADVMMRIGKHEASEVLINVLQNQTIELEVRESAAEALGQIGDDKAIGILVQALQTQQIPEEKGDATIRGVVASALGNIGNEEACTALIQAIQDSELHLDVRVTAARALGNVKVESAKVRARSELVKVVLWSDFHPRLRREAASTLGNIGDQAVVAELKSLIVDPSVEGDVRASIAQCFGYIGGIEALRILEDALSKEMDTLREKVEARLGIAGTLTPILQKDASAIAAEIRSQETLVELLSTVFVDYASEIAKMQESIKDILLAALEQNAEPETQIVIQRVQAYDNIDRLIQDKVLEEFRETKETQSMLPLAGLQIVFSQDNPQAAMSEAIQVRASSLAREILAADSISVLDLILDEIEKDIISADLDSATVSLLLRSAITSRENLAVMTAKGKKWNTDQRFEFLGGLLEKQASQISRLAAQVDADRDVANKIIEALGMFKSAATSVERESRLIAIATLKQVVEKDYYEDIRVKAMKALGEIGGDDVVRILETVAREQHFDKDVRIGAITVLGKVATDSSILILIELLRDKDQDNDLRRNAALALGDTGDPEARRVLEEVSKDAKESELVRMSADQALQG
jgi:HEAT repeat protein